MQGGRAIADEMNVVGGAIAEKIKRELRYAIVVMGVYHAKVCRTK